jgi:uncharacterized protein YqeY
MIQDNIKASIKEAMKAKESLKLEVLRSIQAAFTNELVATKRTPHDEISDEEALAVITRLAKQRKDSIEQYTQGGRADLAESEQAELEILQEYLPDMMDEDEIMKIVQAKKTELGVEDKSKMGMLIGALMKELKGKADGGDVKRIVESLF